MKKLKIIILLSLFISIAIIPSITAKKDIKTEMGEDWYNEIKIKVKKLLMNEWEHGRFLFNCWNEPKLYEKLYNGTALICFLRGKGSIPILWGIINTPHLLYLKIYLPIRIRYYQYYPLFSRVDAIFITQKIFNEVIS